MFVPFLKASTTAATSATKFYYERKSSQLEKCIEKRKRKLKVCVKGKKEMKMTK